MITFKSISTADSETIKRLLKWCERNGLAVSSLRGLDSGLWRYELALPLDRVTEYETVVGKKMGH